MTFLRENTHKTLPNTMFLHKVGWSGLGSDDPAKQWMSALCKSGWSGLSPDDSDLVICELLVEARPDDLALHRMIRTWEIQCVFSLFCQHPGWSEVTPDDPGTTRKHTIVTFGGWSIYTPSPPSFTSLSLSDQPRLQNIKSSTSLPLRAWFLQGNS